MTRADEDSASARIDKTIAELGDWRGATLDARAFQALIRAAVEFNTARAK